MREPRRSTSGRTTATRAAQPFSASVTCVFLPASAEPAQVRARSAKKQRHHERDSAHRYGSDVRPGPADLDPIVGRAVPSTLSEHQAELVEYLPCEGLMTALDRVFASRGTHPGADIGPLSLSEQACAAAPARYRHRPGVVGVLSSVHVQL